MFIEQSLKKWVESGLSTFEIWRLVAEIYFSEIRKKYFYGHFAV